MQKLHELNTAFKTKIKKSYKSCCLMDINNKRLIAYNVAGKPIEPKFKEIETKLENSPEGVYYLHCQQNYGSKSEADIFPIKNGNVNNLSEGGPVIHYMPNPNTPQVTENFLSRDEAYKNMQEITRLTIENEILKQKVSDLETEIEKEPLNEGGAVKNWLSEIIPTVAPILDQYFSTKNREIDLKERSLNNTQHKRVVRTQKPTKRMWPDVNNKQELENFLTDMENLTDEQFNQVLEITKVEAPELHNVILNEFIQEEETDENENETE